MELRHAKWRIAICKHFVLSNSSWVYLLQSVIYKALCLMKSN